MASNHSSISKLQRLHHGSNCIPLFMDAITWLLNHVGIKGLITATAPERCVVRHRDVPIVINPDYNMNKQLFMKRIYDKICLNLYQIHLQQYAHILNINLRHFHLILDHTCMVVLAIIDVPVLKTLQYGHVLEISQNKHRIIQVASPPSLPISGKICGDNSSTWSLRFLRITWSCTICNVHYCISVRRWST